LVVSQDLKFWLDSLEPSSTFFNHQTHHRGQVSMLLSQAGIDIGVTDLLALIPDEAQK
jgi:uncharacterized damage-inducible protein DinB